MSAVRRYPLGQGRELVVSETAGFAAFSVRDGADGPALSGPLVLPIEDIEVVRSALRDLIEVRAEQASP